MEVYVGVFVGAVTFTGSIVACGKLHGTITSKLVMLPGRQWLNVTIIIPTIVLAGYFLATDSTAAGVASEEPIHETTAEEVREIIWFLRDKGVDVRFAIHPVAGRLP